MAATDFIVAIELGSTEITGIAGKKNADGSIHLLAYASEHSSDCIKKGAIYNLDKTAQSLTSVIKQLEEQLQAPIKKVYVGVGGQSMRSIRNTQTKRLDEDTKISQALIDSILQSNSEISLIDHELLAVEPQEYKVGNNLLLEPVGIPADNIEANFLNIIARTTLKSNIDQCFKQTGYEVADYLMAPIVTADAVLTTNEKRSGCALIDFGADTTTVTVYKNNLLRHVAVIPLGSSNITKDICSLRLEEEDAEQLKKRFASAYTEPSEDEVDFNQELSLDNKCSIRARQLMDIVEARVSEILTNVWNQIMLSDYGDKLLAGIVVTGGASVLPNLDKALLKITKIDKIRIAKTSEISLEGAFELPENGSFNTLIGLLSAGKENCCRIDPKVQPLDFMEDGTQKVVVNESNLQAQAEKRKQECNELVRDASQMIFERKYVEGLELLKKARLLNITTKEVEIDALEKEAKRLYDEAKRVAELKILEEEKEKERARIRAEKCDLLIEEARKEKQRKNYKAAIAKLEDAEILNIEDRKEEIDSLKKEIGSMKKNWWLRSFFEKVTNVSDDLMKD